MRTKKERSYLAGQRGLKGSREVWLDDGVDARGFSVSGRNRRILERPHSGFDGKLLSRNRSVVVSMLLAT